MDHTLLVVTPSVAVAKWAARAVRVGGGNVFRPTVLGPSSIPEVPGAGASPEGALLSVKAHPESVEAGEAAVAALVGLKSAELARYSDALFSWASPTIQELVMAKLMMNLPYPVSDFAKEHFGRGRQEGEAVLLLRLLTQRFGPLSAEVEARVRAADPETLLAWADRVLDAPSIEALLAPLE